MRGSRLFLVALCFSAWGCKPRTNASETKEGPGQQAAAAKLTFDRDLYQLVTQDFKQETYLLTAKVFDALPEAWKESARNDLPAEGFKRRQAIGTYYGLAQAPEGVQEFPLGLTEGMLDQQKVLHGNCYICHASELFGQPVVGLGNNQIDFEGLIEDVVAVSLKHQVPLSPWVQQFQLAKRYHVTFSKTRGSTAPLTFASILLSLRKPDLSYRVKMEQIGQLDKLILNNPLFKHLPDDKKDQLVRSQMMFSMPDMDLDAPSWWLTRANKKIYYDGLIDKSPYPIMQFLADPWASEQDIKKQLPKAEQFLTHLNQIPLPPTYAELFPERVHPEQASLGKVSFEAHCTRCHGTYGPSEKEDVYPGRVVPVAEVRTDSQRANGMSVGFREFLNKSWFGREGKLHTELVPTGYRAPYLRRVALTYPYFHNGSVPTIYHVLFPEERPKKWRVTAQSYDHMRLGQLVDGEPLLQPANAHEARMIYDTKDKGKTATGHEPMVEGLSKEEKLNVLEYLKTL